MDSSPSLRNRNPLFALLAMVLLCSVARVGTTADEPPTGEPGAGTESSEAGSSEATSWSVAEPPGEWRNIVIDTDETTWSNVDVSPDGATIVFDMLGDIFTVPIGGGEATALSSGIDWSYQPRFSPDGSTIAFVSDRGGADNLWLMDADGGDPRPVTDEKEHLVHNPSWSADGRVLVGKKSFMSTRSIAAGEIWLFFPGHQGGGLQLTERPNGKDDQKNQAEPAFSPDGRYVYFSQDVTPGRVWQYGKDATGEIFVIQRLELATGEIERFVTGPGGAVRPTPSPDGRWLAFIKRIPDLRSAIYLKDLDSGREAAVYDRFERDLQETSGTEGNAPAFAWTPDSQQLVFWSGGRFHRLDVASRAVVDIPVHVRQEQRIQETLRLPVEVAPERFRVRMPRWPVVAPDGSFVVFQALGVLWRKELPDGIPRRLTRQDDCFEMFPAFSSDGRSLVYTTWNDQELGTVRVVAAGGGRGRVITRRPGIYAEPRFSPAGDEVVFRQLGGGYLLSPLWSLETGIFVVPVAGGEARLVTDRGATPQWAADGERIFFVADGDPGLELKSVDRSGHDERTHLSGDGLTEMALSPSGQWVAFVEDYRTWVAPLPVTGRTVELGKGTKAIPVRQLSEHAGDLLGWQGDATVTWSHGPTLYRRPLAEAFRFVEGASAEPPEPLAEGIDLSFEVDADRPRGTVALVGGRVVTMRDAFGGVEEIIEDGAVVVSGNRIVAVGPRAEVEVPEGAHVVELAGRTILPGLIDAHAHGGFGRDEILPQQNWMQMSNLAFGVTTIHDPSNDTSEVFAAAELQRAGRIVAPRIFSTGTILYGARGPGVHVEVDSLDDARFHVGRMRDVGAISVKSYQLPRRDARQQLVAAGRELGVMVVPEGGMKYQHNMTEITDGHTTIEHSMTVPTLYEDALQLWMQSGTAYTPTLVVSFGGLEGERWFYDREEVWKNERLLRYTPRSRVEPRAIRRQTAPDSHYNHFQVAAAARELMRRGVLVNTGAHGQREGLAIHWEIRMLGQGGFTPWEALRAATASGARSLGMEGGLGSIEPGKLADQAILDGNPLEDLARTEHIHATMLNGRLYEAATMRQLWPEQVERQPFFWELEGGDTIHPEAASWLEERERRFGCRH